MGPVVCAFGVSQHPAGRISHMMPLQGHGLTHVRQTAVCNTQSGERSDISDILISRFQAHLAQKRICSQRGEESLLVVAFAKSMWRPLITPRLGELRPGPAFSALSLLLQKRSGLLRRLRGSMCKRSRRENLPPWPFELQSVQPRWRLRCGSILDGAREAPWAAPGTPASAAQEEGEVPRPDSLFSLLAPETPGADLLLAVAAGTLCILLQRCSRAAR
eukprot:s640_g10.t1